MAWLLLNILAIYCNENWSRQKNYQSWLKICQRLLKFVKSNKMLPNLVTLFGIDVFWSSDIALEILRNFAVSTIFWGYVVIGKFCMTGDI